MKALHPFSAFCFYAAVIIITAAVQHPLVLLISFFSALLFVLLGKCGKISGKAVLSAVLVCIFGTAVNLLFNNEGQTVLIRLSCGNAVTLETAIYSAFAFFMMTALVLWLFTTGSCFGSDKLMYLFGRTFPSLGLLISMTMRFIPYFAKRFKETAAAQKFLGCDINGKGVKNKLRAVLKITSVALSASLENAGYTAQSMKYRGYGSTKRSFYSVYRFTKRDFAVVTLTLLCVAATVSAFCTGLLSYGYYPVFKVHTDALGIPALLLWGAFCLIPCGITLYDEIKWRRSHGANKA